MTVAIKTWATCGAMSLGLIGCLGGAADAAVRIEGQVQIGGGALAGSTVSLWAASADAPVRLAQVQTDAEGRFVVSADATPSGASSLYLVASSGTPAINKAGGDNKGIDLLAVLGNDPPPKVVVNELTTVASAFTNARFIKLDEGRSFALAQSPPPRQAALLIGIKKQHGSPVAGGDDAEMRRQRRFADAALARRDCDGSHAQSIS